MKKCYWLGWGNLQTEYDYEPSEELVEDVGDDIIQLDESQIEFFVTESSEWEEELEKFVRNPEIFCESWLEALMRITPIEPDFLERAIPAMAKGFLYILTERLCASELDPDWKAECIEELSSIVKGD